MISWVDLENKNVIDAGIPPPIGVPANEDSEKEQ